MDHLFNSNSSKNRSRRDLVHERCRSYTRSPSKGHFKKLKDLFLFCGEQVRIEYGFHCDYGDKIEIGDNTYINFNCSIIDGGYVKIGKDVLIGPNVQIITINHPTNSIQRLKKNAYIKDVEIGDNVWIGAGAIILPGTTIQNNVVIAAGSVVRGKIDENCLYAGNPSQKVKLIN